MKYPILGVGQPAGPATYVILGAVLLAGGLVLVSNYRGLTQRYVGLALRSRGRSEASLARYRIWYGVVAALGLLMLVSGILRLIG